MIWIVVNTSLGEGILCSFRNSLRVELDSVHNDRSILTPHCPYCPQFLLASLQLQKTEMLKRWHGRSSTLNTLIAVVITPTACDFSVVKKEDLQNNISPREESLLPWILRAILRQHRALDPASSSETPPPAA